MRKVAIEAYRTLKKGKQCAVMVGDVRKYGKVIPLGFRVMECFLQAGFLNQEIIIKEQHNCHSTNYWKSKIEISYYWLMNMFLCLKSSVIFR